MEKFIVEGEVQLKGNIRIGGAKNAALPIMAATVLGAGIHVLYDVPLLRDVVKMQEILSVLGAKLKWEGRTLIIDTTHMHTSFIPEELMREMRASVFLLGALVGRFGEASVSYPGGCTIGPRPIDLHMKALKKLGVSFTEQYGLITAEVKSLSGNEIVFDFPSVGATENAMMAAVLADGTTLIRNAAREPEIFDLQEFLNKMGADISGGGTDTIQISGVKSMHGAVHTIMPDRIEAGTFLIAAAMTQGDVTLENACSEHLSSLLDKLSAVGASVNYGQNFIRLKAGRLDATDIKTLPYPGFPTDLQAPMLALLTIAKGTSIITETIFENRFQHVDQLIRMGAQIKVEGRNAIIRGIAKLSGASVKAFDLRAGGALVLASLAAMGTSEIKSIYHIDRGYEHMEYKLRQLGAQIVRLP